jgi:hypothetical protein
LQIWHWNLACPPFPPSLSSSPAFPPPLLVVASAIFPMISLVVCLAGTKERVTRMSRVASLSCMGRCRLCLGIFTWLRFTHCKIYNFNVRSMRLSSNVFRRLEQFERGKYQQGKFNCDVINNLFERAFIAMSSRKMVFDIPHPGSSLDEETLPHDPHDHLLHLERGQSSILPSHHAHK